MGFFGFFQSEDNLAYIIDLVLGVKDDYRHIFFLYFRLKNFCFKCATLAIHCKILIIMLFQSIFFILNNGKISPFAIACSTIKDILNSCYEHFLL